MSRFGPIVLKRPRNQMLLTCLTWALGVSTATDKHPSICPFELGKSHQRKSSKLCDVPQQLGCGGQASKSRFHSALDAGRFCLQWESSCCHEGCLGEGALGDGFSNDFCACFLFFCFHSFKKCFPTNDMGFPSWVGLKMSMLHQQEWQGGRAGSLMEAIFQQSLNVQKCPEVV